MLSRYQNIPRMNDCFLLTTLLLSISHWYHLISDSHPLSLLIIHSLFFTCSQTNLPKMCQTLLLHPSQGKFTILSPLTSSLIIPLLFSLLQKHWPCKDFFAFPLKTKVVSMSPSQDFYIFFSHCFHHSFSRYPTWLDSTLDLGFRLWHLIREVFPNHSKQNSTPSSITISISLLS